MSESNDAMTEAHHRLTIADRSITQAIDQLLFSHQGPVVVALDGGSGAGESTLAAFLQAQFNAARIPLDDLFAASIPDSQWDRFAIEERFNYVFEWQRLRESVLEPLRAGQPARWYAFDFAAGLRSGGTYGRQREPVERKPAKLIILEGAYSACPLLADLVGLAILVDVSVETRHKRLASREAEDFLQVWHQRWDAVDSFCFTQVKSRSSFDLVVKLE